MAKIPFLEFLASGQTLLADGAMGTRLHQAGAKIDACFDALNLTDPEVIEQIHHDYISAGARLIETNTFGANRYKLADYGLRDQAVTINRTAVEIAARAIAASGRDDVYLAGSVGPLGARMRPYGRINKDEVREAFVEQIGSLAEAGVDLILLETFTDHEEILIALEVVQAIRKERGIALPVMAQMTFTPEGRTLLGFTPARVTNELRRAGADVIGVNCSTGPSQIAQILQAMHQAAPNAHFSAMPNAGYPESVGGRIMYPATADYFGDYALTFKSIGASIIGGCCGTTIDHIRAMRQALDDPERQQIPSVEVSDMHGETLPVRSQAPTMFHERLLDGRFTVTVEVSPPRSFSAEHLLSQVRMLRDAGADVVNVADTPAARMRMSAWAVCHLINTQIGMETVLHFPTRGRNVLRVQGDLLAAHALDLRNLFITMGDPTRIGDYPEAMDQYDIAPSKLIALIKQKMNQGVDLAGSSIGDATAFTVGCAINMFADDLDHEINLTLRKQAAGADFALGQSVFDPAGIERFIRRYEVIAGQPFNLPVLMGILPLYNLRHARFLHHEVPGISIPDGIMTRIERAGDDAPAVGVRIAQELLRDIQGMVAGIYVIPAFGRYELAAEVLDALAVRG